MQCTLQARWLDDPVVMCLPHVEEHNADLFSKIKLDYPFLTLPTLKEAVGKNYEALAGALRGELEEPQIEQIYKVIQEMPALHVDLRVRGQLGRDAEVERKISQPMTRDTWIEIHAGMVS